ncbi:MAG: ROK family protein [Chloroflexi bacterium]|nr:ROK family protein [Chloroflexota bacterium]MCL5107285.1 ROK family protein [Chloroflexota bacterium]
MTRLTPATISNVISELANSNLVVELGAERRAGGPYMGRRRLLVDLNARGWYAAGVYLGIRSIQVGLGDLRGRVLAKVSFPSPGRRSPEAVFSLVEEQLRRLLTEVQVPREQLCGLGVASVGLVDSALGEIVDLPQYGWRGVAAKANLEQLLGLPVAVDNSRRVMATAEAWLGANQDADSILFVHVATTVGGAAVYQREVLHGASYAAGQLGHIIVVEDGDPCVCGHRGCLDTVSSGAAMVAQAARAARAGRSPVLAALGKGKPEDLPFDALFSAAQQGDGVASELIARSADYLGIGVAHYVSLFDPQVVILTGGIALLGGENYRHRVEKVVNERAYRPSCATVSLLPSSFGREFEMVGPLSLALRQFVYSSESWPLASAGARSAPTVERLAATV